MLNEFGHLSMILSVSIVKMWLLFFMAIFFPSPHDFELKYQDMMNSYDVEATS